MAMCQWMVISTLSKCFHSGLMGIGGHCVQVVRPFDMLASFLFLPQMFTHFPVRFVLHLNSKMDRHACHRKCLPSGFNHAVLVSVREKVKVKPLCPATPVTPAVLATAVTPAVPTAPVTPAIPTAPDSDSDSADLRFRHSRSEAADDPGTLHPVSMISEYSMSHHPV